eukprot:gene55613-44511_t
MSFGFGDSTLVIFGGYDNMSLWNASTSGYDSMHTSPCASPTHLNSMYFNAHAVVGCLGGLGSGDPESADSDLGMDHNDELLPIGSPVEVRKVSTHDGAVLMIDAVVIGYSDYSTPQHG